MSPIPMTPFEAMHARADVPFGTAVSPEIDSIGYMPFTWMQDGMKVSANPVLFEYKRANVIWRIWNSLRQALMLNYRTTGGG